MKEVQPDSKFVESGPVATPSEESLITITLLARLYDVGMAILTNVDPDVAGAVFEAHDRGELMNPTLFVPDFGGEQ